MNPPPRSRRPKRRARSIWLPISTAPKDEQILLLYPGHDQLPFVCQGRWIDVPHENVYLHVLRNDHLSIEEEDRKGRWEVGYIATCGDSSETTHWKASSFTVFPTHWQPLPRVPERLPRAYSRHG